MALQRKLDETRSLLPPNRFVHLRYEDLVRDPVAQMRALYELLDLGDFESVRPAVEQYAKRSSRYQTNHYELSAEQRYEIANRWGLSSCQNLANNTSKS